MLTRFREDNPEALALVEQDGDSGRVAGMPANVCCVAVKEASGKLRVFLHAGWVTVAGHEELDAGGPP